MAISSTRVRPGLVEMVSFALIGLTVLLSVALIFDISLFGGIMIPVLALCVACTILMILYREGKTSERLRHRTWELQRKVEEAEEKNRWLKLTEQRAHVGHWRLDLRTNEVYWSEETSRIHGLEPGNAPPLDDAIDLFHPDDRALVSESVENARITGEPFTFRARIVRPDGEIRHAESIAKLEYDSYGNPAALFGILADRTEEEAMRAKLRASRDEAKALSEAKTSFLAKMSHEIRTPMNGVLGFADLLLTSKLTETQRHHVALIVESGKNLQTLLNDILDLSKVDAGQMQVEGRPTHLAELIDASVRLVEPLAREKNVALVNSVDAGLPTHVIVDPVRLRQIISNLLSNAMRFTDHGQVAVHANLERSRLVISVTDTGIGIAKDMHDSVFDPFSMVDPANIHGRGGTGLGLPICRQLAELMGGSMKLESEKGKGSRFIVSLPLVDAGQQGPEEDAQKSASALKSGTVRSPILLAEDFDINRVLVLEMGKRLGLEIHEAKDGAESVAKVREASRQGRPYALVLMDIQMPVMNGLEAARVIREAGYDAQSLPILALTANAFAEDVEKCKEAGMQEHLAKPLSFDAFREAIARWIPTDKARAA